MQTLNEIANTYLKSNGISIRHFAECTKIEYTKCKLWLKGDRELTAVQIKNVHDFLNDKYKVFLSDIIKEV